MVLTDALCAIAAAADPGQPSAPARMRTHDDEQHGTMDLFVAFDAPASTCTLPRPRGSASSSAGSPC